MSDQTLIQKHLSKFVKDAMTQKFRLDRLINDYVAFEIKQRERVIDELDLIEALIQSGVGTEEQLNSMNERKEKDQALRDKAQLIITEGKGTRNKLIDDVQHHLRELSKLEITSGGFVTHTITSNAKAKVDETTKIVNISKDGHLEIPISTYLGEWKDGTQMRILPVKKKGV